MRVKRTTTPDSYFGEDQVWPPGFRFHPTDEELVVYYLKRKICGKRLHLDVIRETDVYKWDPEELPAQSILKTGDRLWFFFSPRERRYLNGARSNRGTEHGYWKTTGKDRTITCSSRTVGVKKTLVFYRGRAPNGVRTDWVMHEYTLDEDELKRCQNIKDYFALYKVYKKSGPGPKNGEQYGAPFKEEDWVDEECVAKPVDAVSPLKLNNWEIPDDSVNANGQVQSQSNDLEEFRRQPTDDQVLALPQAYVNHELPLNGGEEETQSTLIDPSPKPHTFFHDQASFGFSQSPTSQLQSHEATEIASVANQVEQVSQICGDDFLEINDLLGPEPVNSQAKKLSKSMQFDDLDGLSELDLFHDTAMFLRDIGPIGQGIAPFSYADGMMNQVSYQLQPHSNENLVNQQLQSHLNASEDIQQLQPHLNVAGDNQQWQSHPNSSGDNQQWQSHFSALGNNQLLQPQLNSLEDSFLNQFQPVGNELDQQLHMKQIDGKLWTHDQNSDVFTAGSNIENVSQTSGITYNGLNQDQGDKNNGGDASWFSSALWSFVESIPTTPASASESPLVNRAFERVSSFNRLRLNVRHNNLSAVNGVKTARMTGGSRIFIFISTLGALCAILWVLVRNR